MFGPSGTDYVCVYVYLYTYAVELLEYDAKIEDSERGITSL